MDQQPELTSPEAESTAPLVSEERPLASPWVVKDWREWLPEIDPRDLLTGLLLLVILAAGYGLRSAGRNWDDFTHLHPDERFLTDVASRVGNSPLNHPPEQADLKTTCEARYPAPSEDDLQGMSFEEREYALSRTGRGGYFDAECSDLNPNNIGFGLYVYGEFPLFVTRITAETAVEIEKAQCRRDADNDEERDACDFQARTSYRTSYYGIHLTGRLVSSLADTLTILLVFLIGLKLFGRPQGLLAAVLYAFAAFPIQQSHFWTVDAFTTFWVTLAIYAAIHVLDHDASRPARFSPLLWIAGAVGVWVWEAEHLDEPTLIPLVFYGAAFALSAGAASLITRQQQLPFAGMGYLAGVLALVIGLVMGEITPLGMLIVLVLMAMLSVFIVIGLNKLAAYGGTWAWLGAAFCLWVYDGLAHYPQPSLTPLVLYLVIFGVGSLLASAVYQARAGGDALRWLVMLGVPLLLWILLDGIAGAFSWQGMAFSVFLLVLLGAATISGYRDYTAFGVAFGAALASRVNIAPLVGLLFLAILIRSLPILDRRTVFSERDRLLFRAVIGMVIAGVVTVIFFRVLQPHAFKGLYGDNLHIGILPSGFNPGWRDDVEQARYFVSGDADIPPNHQWANRTPYLFPWQNISIWGLGLPLGLAGWIGLLLAWGVILRGKPAWMRLALLTAWITVYFGWLGKNWVTTMRYFLPLYGTLTLFAAWLLVGFILWAWRREHESSPFFRRLALGVSALLLVVVLGHTLLYGYGMTNLHHTLLTRVAASLWFQENVPGDVGIWVDKADGTRSLQNIGTNTVSSAPVTVRLEDGETVNLPLTLSLDSVVQSVVLHRVTDPLRDDDPERIRIRIQRAGDSIFEPQVIAERILDADVNQGLGDFGDEYSIRFDDREDQPILLTMLPLGDNSVANYEVEITVLRGGPVALTRGVGDNILPVTLDHVTVYLLDNQTQQPFTQSLLLDDPNESAPPYTFYMPSQQGQTVFTARASGTIHEIEIPHLADPLGDVDEETLRVEISGTTGEVAYGQISGNFTAAEDGNHRFGQPVTIPLDPPLEVQAGGTYTLTLVSDAPLITLGAVVATEGPWDDALPYKVCPLENGVQLEQDTPSGYSSFDCVGIDMFSTHYYGIELYMAAEDDERKRETMLEVLDKADYLTISSNRFYDSLSRIPTRFPMSIDYYDVLFSGELGFELVLEWTSYPRVWDIEWKNQVLPTDDLPAWMNEYEVEEAFTVYDHPAIFVFRKTDVYSPERVRQLLDTNLRQYKETFGGLGADALPVNRNVVIAPQASVAPSALMLPDDLAAEQKHSTWSDMFDVKASINENQTLAVVVWWLLMLVIGWITFPLLFAMLPALPDRGYGASKAAGLVVVAWLAWMGGALRLGIWSQNGIALCLGIVLVVSLGFAYAHRSALRGFVRDRWLHLLTVEALTFVLFLTFLYVRYRNPDLWHNVFGGEKPMDFAYFNGVLRSTVFPPLDPWFSGGYINYYYWGYVLAGTPTKLLGMVPAMAYNLLIPTIFSLVGIGTFTIAYNLVGAYGGKRAYADAPLHGDDRPATEPRPPRANPYVAGTAALLLVVVLGNLDTMRLFVTEVAKVGGWEGFATTDDRRLDLLADFRQENGREPDINETVEIEEQAKNPSFFTQTGELISGWSGMVMGFFGGIWDVAVDGAPLQMATHRWYWAPTRVIGELPDGKGHNAINEMPYFTFLYGDLHAHMLSMPIILLVILWLSGEVMGAGYGLRGNWAAGLSLFFGGLSVGLLRATNTWDLPTFLILGAAGLTFAAWLTQKRRREQAAVPTPTADRLRRYLDPRHALDMWFLILLIPAGMVLHLIYWAVRRMLYDSALGAGEIPQACVQLSDLPNLVSSQVPELCQGKLKPVFHLSQNITWGIGFFALAIGLYMVALVLAGERFDKQATLNWLGRLALFGIVSFAVVVPFTAWYAGDAGLVPWEQDRTPLWAYLDIHGLFMFILFSLLVWQSVRLLKRFTVGDLYGMGIPALLVIFGVPLTLLAALVIGLTSVPVMLVTLPMMVWGSGLFLIPGTSRAERTIYALMVLALGLTTGVELVVLNVDIGRQNMVFKFYLQAWLLFGIASGVAVAWLLSALPRWNFAVRYLWQMVLAVLVTIAFMYPIMATQARWQDRFDPTRTGNTLDGQAYMQYAVYGDNAVWYNLRGDYEMIQWIDEHIQGTPTIIEAQTTEYKWGSRISINTGLPTVIGWNWHQRQQRSVLDLNQLVWNRSNNVAAFYNTTSVDEAWNLIRFYGIDYIILGVQERVTYNDLLQDPFTQTLTSGLNAGLNKFDRMVEMGLLEPVYQSPTCVASQPLTVEECDPQNVVMDKIYRVKSHAPLDVAMLVGD